MPDDELPNTRIDFAIIGGGWRAEFYLRIARAMPQRFRVTGLVTRSAERGRALTQQWQVPTFASVEALLEDSSGNFVVVSVPSAAAPDIILSLANRGVPVLSETPPGATVEAIKPLHAEVAKGRIIQVAEQYHLQPLLSAQLAIAESGQLGQISEAHTAQTHDHHGISVMRRALGVGFESARVSASVFRSPLAQGPNRAGDPDADSTIIATQTSARFEIDGKLGVYEFAPAHYFSWIRANRVLIRGGRGEIIDREVRYLQDFRTPMFQEIVRIETGQGGNLEGKFLRGLVAGDEWLYRNRFIPARLSDDELALAEALARMAEHVEGGPQLYSLADATQDLYLGLVMHQAAESGETLTTERQPWADARAR